MRNEPTIAPEAVHLWERTVLRCDYLFSNSQSVKQSLQREYNLPSEIVPTGVDTSFFTPAWDRPANPRPRVLFVGSLRPFKQPQLLAGRRGPFSRGGFCPGGRRPDGGRIESADRARATQKRHAHAVCWRAEELKQQYQQADIFLFPSSLGRISEGPAGSGGVRPAGDCTKKLSAGNRSSWANRLSRRLGR